MVARSLGLVLALGMTLAGSARASDVGYIHGRVETVEGQKYVGPIRWGSEESFWDDIFNANKAENPHLEAIDPKVLERLRRRSRNDLDFIFGPNYDFDHLFAIRFGDLKRIDVRPGENLVVTFRNGEKLKLKDGSNDVGALIRVFDSKLGVKELRWNRIRTIDFTDTPARLADRPGEPIYGTVRAGRYEFQGRVQWDNDECLSVDKLDGDTDDGDVSIAFKDIAAIRKRSNGSMVTLKSGTQVFLTGSNDVNHQNRGVVVVVPNLGSVKIGWRDFDELRLSRAPSTGPAYADYAAASDLEGTVVTRSGRHAGRIVFDLDESWDFEMLQGTNGDTEYLIPFREIARIKPSGGLRSTIVLKSGMTVVLQDSQDVTRKNDGLLVYDAAGDPAYVPWRDVTEVVFR